MPTLRGHIISGAGNFSFWIEKLHTHYLRKTGMSLFPGTLNVQLDADYTLPERRIRLEAHEYGGDVSVNLIPCTIFGRPAFILRTDANEAGRGDHPRSLIEIACDIKLRDAYNLADGDIVEIETPPAP